MSWSDDDDVSNFTWGDPSAFDDNQGGKEDREDTYGAQHVQVLIDCRPSMFVKSIPTEDGEMISPMQASLVACETLLRNKVKHVAVHKTGRRDGVGIMLYGKQDPTPHTVTLVEMQAPGMQQIQKIRNYVLGKTDVRTDAGIKDGNVTWSLRRGLQDANTSFNQAKCVKKRTASDKALPDGKSLWIFTNDDNPTADDQEPDKIEKAASDLVENDIDIHFWPMKTTFNADFYDSILTTPVDTQEDTLDMEELMDRIKREFRKHRVAFRLPMLLPNWRDNPEDPGIMIDFFRPIQIQKKPQPKTIHQETKRETFKVTTMVNAISGETLYTSNKREGDANDDAAKRGALRHITYFGDRTVPVSKNEVAEMKKLSNANSEKSNLILLGFKPQSSLPIHYTVEQAFYLYPNEDKVKGSTAAFANLHDAMKRKGVYAIAELLTRATATSRLLAIFPQDEMLHPDGGGDVEVPQCMAAYSLPFEDDVRAAYPDSGTATEESVQAATELIQAMDFGENFSLDYFKNDALLHFYTYMESIALETTLPAPEQSLNQVTDEDICATAGKQIEAFTETIPEDIVAVKEPKKRQREPDESGIDWVATYRANELSDCTVPQLKSYLKSVGEKVGGKKAEVVERVSGSIAARLAKGEFQDV